MKFLNFRKREVFRNFYSFPENIFPHCSIFFLLLCTDLILRKTKAKQTKFGRNEVENKKFIKIRKSKFARTNNKRAKDIKEEKEKANKI